MSKPTLLATTAATMSCSPGATKNSFAPSFSRRIRLAIACPLEAVSARQATVRPSIQLTLFFRLDLADLDVGAVGTERAGIGGDPHAARAHHRYVGIVRRAA